MSYSIGEMSRMTGFSPSAIRFYEAAGVLSPRRRRSQKYRVYEMQDYFLLLSYRWCRNLGFSLREAEELLNKTTPTAIAAVVDRRMQCVLKELEYKRLQAQYLTRWLATLKLSVEQRRTCRIRNSPALLRLATWQPGCRDGDAASLDQVADWWNRLPFVDDCYLYAPEDILNGHGMIEGRWGVSIEEKTAKLLSFPASDRVVERIPSRKCVHIFYEVDKELRVNSRELLAARRFLRQNDLVVRGPAIGLSLYHAEFAGRNSMLWQLYIPVKSAR